MVVVTGNLGILSQSQLEKLVQGGALPASITRKNRRLLSKGLLSGRLEDSLRKTKDQKIKSSDLSPSVFDSLFVKLGLRKEKIGLVSGTGPLSGLKELKKLQNAESLQKKMFGKVITKGNNPGGIVSSLFGFAQKGAFAQAVFGTLIDKVIPAAIITKLGTAIWKMYKSQYGKGGTRDVRKLILSEDVSRIGIENENELESGANLFFSNPQVLSGLSRGPSNTENLREGMARWKQRHEGTYGR